MQKLAIRSFLIVIFAGAAVLGMGCSESKPQPVPAPIDEKPTPKADPVEDEPRPEYTADDPGFSNGASEEPVTSNTDVESNRPQLSTTRTGLRYIELSGGTGPKPTSTDEVTVHYEGKTLDGVVFDSSYKHGTPIEFKLSHVIKGWQEGLQLMNCGSRYQFIIPPHLAYGEAGAGDAIGPNETLVFEVELLKVNGECVPHAITNTAGPAPAPVAAREPRPSAPPAPEPRPSAPSAPVLSPDPETVSNSTPDTVFTVVEDRPEFPGCDGQSGCNSDAKLQKFIDRNLQYPAIAKENGVEGTVMISFVVGKDGRVRDAQILRDIGAQCGAEALRVINLMNDMPQKWIPGRQRGKAVSVKLVQPIKFRLE